MRVTRSRSLLPFAFVAASALAGCGGGGSDDPEAPGSLSALALEGEAAPSTGGTFGRLTGTTLAAVANGGWAAFVAPIEDGFVGSGLFLSNPDGETYFVYGVGDALPDSVPGTGTIASFDRVFVTADGVVTAVVSGTGPSRGVVSARLDDEEIVDRYGTVYTGSELPLGAAGQDPGTLTTIDANLVAVDDQGSVFFMGTGSGASPLRGIYAVRRNGDDLTAVVTSNDALPGGGVSGSTFRGLGIDADGGVVAYCVNVLGGPGGGAIFATDGSTVYTVARDDDAPTFVSARTLDDVYAGGPILVSYGEGVLYVSWTGELSGGSPSLGVFTRQILPDYSGLVQTILAAGQSTGNSAGDGSYLGDCRLLSCSQDPSRLTIEALVAGGTTDRIFASSAGPDVSADEIFRQGEEAPDADGEFWSSYPSLSASFATAASDNGSLAFSAKLSDGDTGVWWAVRGEGHFRIASEGASAPGTGSAVFAPFGGASMVTASNDTLLFSADLVGGVAASGLFVRR